MEKHVTALGILYIIFAAFNLLLALMIWMLFLGTGAIVDDPGSGAILATIGTIGAIFFVVTALPGLIVGIGLLKYQSWARILAIVLGVVILVDPPFGTALGIYTLWVMFRPEIKDRFTARHAG